MSWEQEWKELKAQASSKVAVNLNSAGADKPGWASGGVKSSKKGWNGAAAAAHSLGRKLHKGTSTLHEGQKGLGRGTPTGGETESGTAQYDLYKSWDEYLGALRRRCTVLGDLLGKVGNSHHANDEETRQQISRLGKKYRDTDHIGGQGRGA
ncbi:hypothetical protein ACH4RA_27300 [Streptomyces smyrnaeus]|uniref:hypothetical protein n=1 Tax=Streptomyces smyrnaeus TaxID=1387713 RepID=UPI0033CE97B9